jgi:hypothetical protein
VNPRNRLHIGYQTGETNGRAYTRTPQEGRALQASREHLDPGLWKKPIAACWRWRSSSSTRQRSESDNYKTAPCREQGSAKKKTPDDRREEEAPLTIHLAVAAGEEH